MNQRIQTQILAGHCLIAAALWATLLPGLYAQTPAAPSVDTLRREFLNPPDAAKPMVRWWWFGTAVVKPEILRELQQMKADGIGGAELAFEYPLVLDDSAKGLKNLPFLSPEMLDDVKYAQAEGRKLGLRIDVTLGSGWPYGGPNTSLADASSRLRIVQIPVPANATSVAVPALAEGESLISTDLVNGTAGAAPAQAGLGILRPAAPPPPPWDAASAQPLEVSGAAVAVTPSGKPRVALFFIASHTLSLIHI